MKIDFEFQFSVDPPNPTLYVGTTIYNIPPNLYARVDKAIRKEKNWYDQGSWKYSRNTKLTSVYNDENNSVLFRLEVFRREELLQDLVRKSL